MVKQSGLVELRQFVNDQFRTRATTLKLRGVLLALEKLIRDNPRDGADDLRAGIERIRPPRTPCANSRCWRPPGRTACRYPTRTPPRRS